MAAGERKTAGISAGGIIVIAGILAIMFWSFWIGLVIVLIGLIAFGGFARGSGTKPTAETTARQLRASERQNPAVLSGFERQSTEEP